VPVRYEAREWGIDLTYVTGFRTFLTFGRAVHKGKLALWVLARHTVTVKREEADGDGEESEEKRLFFGLERVEAEHAAARRSGGPSSTAPTFS
jgi:hypothetical protein